MAVAAEDREGSQGSTGRAQQLCTENPASEPAKRQQKPHSGGRSSTAGSQHRLRAPRLSPARRATADGASAPASHPHPLTASLPLFLCRPRARRFHGPSFPTRLHPPRASTQNRVLQPKLTSGSSPCQPGAGLCSALRDQVARVTEGTNPNTSRERGQPRHAQPHETPSHPIPALKPGAPKPSSPRPVRSAHGPHTAQLPQQVPSVPSRSGPAPAHRAQQLHEPAAWSRRQRQLFQPSSGSRMAREAQGRVFIAWPSEPQLAASIQPRSLSAVRGPLPPAQLLGLMLAGAPWPAPTQPWVLPPRRGWATPAHSLGAEGPSNWPARQGIWGQTDQERGLAPSRNHHHRQSTYSCTRTRSYVSGSRFTVTTATNLSGVQHGQKEGQCRARVAGASTSSPASAAGIS